MNRKNELLDLIDKLDENQINLLIIKVEKMLINNNLTDKLSITSDSKRNRYHAKNYLIEYEDVGIEKVKEKLDAHFSGEEISITANSNTISALIKCKKQKK